MRHKLIGLLIPALLILSVNTCTTTTSTSKLVSIEDYTFAMTGENDRLVSIDGPAVYKKGDAVHMVLLNVGPFKKDSTGLNWFDIDMEVTGPDGQVILTENGLLGDEGHISLENNMAKSPYATCFTTPELLSGKYKFRISIYDRIGNGKATQTASFTLE